MGLLAPAEQEKLRDVAGFGRKSEEAIALALSAGPDVTWRHDIAQFEASVADGRTSMENDWWIGQVLRAVST